MKKGSKKMQAPARLESSLARRKSLSPMKDIGSLEKKKKKEKEKTSV